MAENEMNKGLSQVSIRLVQESPLLSTNRSILLNRL